MEIIFGLQLLYILVLIAGIAVFVLFIIVLIKLNKALDIWLKQNKRD